MPDVFQFKAIKPKKLKIDKIRMEILNALRAEGRDVTKEYEKTTASWRVKPKFETMIGLTRAEGASVFVGTDDEIYGYVDQGTRPHVIRPRRARFLRFRTGYKAKTSPRKIGSGPGGASGPVRFAKIVHHPGTQPREFSPTIRKRRRRKFTRRMVKAMQAGAKKAY